MLARNPFASCAGSLLQTAQSFPYNGGSGNVRFALPKRCGWTAASNANWITVLSDSSGIGSGTVTYFVEMNTSGSPRSGAITIGGQTFSVYQLEW